ncbi:MAG: nicotinate-nicotinamide nucleotide adenylyltransferase [Anaerolineae bacterium]
MCSGATLVFGLSADPVHRGHVEMVVQSFGRLRDLGYPMAQVVMVPVYRRNPVGPAKERLAKTYHHRYVMCGLAAREIARRLGLAASRVIVSDVEARLAAGRKRPNYTAETLSYLKLRSQPRRRLVFLISSELVSGSDPEFGRWYEPRTILRLADLAICPRPGYAPNPRFLAALRRQGGCVVYLPDVETPDISSTELRQALSSGQSPLALAHRGLLAPSVARYLHVRDVYAGEAPNQD